MSHNNYYGRINFLIFFDNQHTAFLFPTRFTRRKHKDLNSIRNIKDMFNLLAMFEPNVWQKIKIRCFVLNFLLHIPLFNLPHLF